MSTVREQLNGYRAQARAFWSERTEQERRFLAVGGIVVAVGLVYGLLIDPALSGREQLNKTLPQLRQEAAELQALAAEAAQLSAQPPLQAPLMTKESLNAGLSSRGLTPASLVMTGEYAKVEFKAASFAGIVTWLDAIRRENRIAVQDANFTAQTPAGMVDATMTLRQER
jgi:general secretion pathway protein M